jgi:hypothetical protein
MDLGTSTFPKHKLRCFLAFKFDFEKTDAMALAVEEHLKLLDVDVVTGRPYEPRTVEEKVRSRLNDSDLDFLIVIITVERVSTWIMQEAGNAHLKGLHVIPLVEEGVDLNQLGILKNIERIPFPSEKDIEMESGQTQGKYERQIGKTFIKLRQGIDFIRKVRDSSSAGQK